MEDKKLWIESQSGLNNATNFGMSSAAGCTVTDLPTDVAPGSSAFDYSTTKIYFYDGTEWKEG